MAQQNARELVIKRESDTTPGTFVFVCGFRTRTFSMSNAQIDTTVPNCADPSQPIVATAIPGRQTLSFSGDGLFDNDEVGKAVADDARLQRTDKNYQVVIPGYGTFEGPFFVGDFEWSGEMEERMAFSASFIPLNNADLAFTAEAA